jgi:hypothetical protein
MDALSGFCDRVSKVCFRFDKELTGVNFHFILTLLFSY